MHSFCVVKDYLYQFNFIEMGRVGFYVKTNAVREVVTLNSFLTVTIQLSLQENWKKSDILENLG